MQEVNISDSVKLLDSPGIIASPSNSQVSLALRGLTLEEGKESVLEAVRCLIKQCDQTLVRGIPMTRNTDPVSIFNLKRSVCFLPSTQITLQYNIPNFRNSLEFLTLFAKKRGYVQKGQAPNTEQAATVFLADWTG